MTQAENICTQHYNFDLKLTFPVLSFLLYYNSVILPRVTDSLVVLTLKRNPTPVFLGD